MAGPTGAKFNAESPDLRQLYLDVKAMPGRLQVELRRGIKEAAQSVADRAKDVSGSWSRRIPAATTLAVSFTSRSTGVSVSVNGKKAPHARPIDHAGKPGTFRHPVYGRDSSGRFVAKGSRKKGIKGVLGVRGGRALEATWVEQKARPFFASSVDAKAPDIERRINQVANDVARKAGFIN